MEPIIRWSKTILGEIRALKGTPSLSEIHQIRLFIIGLVAQFRQIRYPHPTARRIRRMKEAARLFSISLQLFEIPALVTPESLKIVERALEEIITRFAASYRSDVPESTVLADLDKKHNIDLEKLKASAQISTDRNDA